MRRPKPLSGRTSRQCWWLQASPPVPELRLRAAEAPPRSRSHPSRAVRSPQPQRGSQRDRLGDAQRRSPRKSPTRMEMCLPGLALACPHLEHAGLEGAGGPGRGGGRAGPPGWWGRGTPQSSQSSLETQRGSPVTQRLESRPGPNLRCPRGGSRLPQREGAGGIGVGEVAGDRRDTARENDRESRPARCTRSRSGLTL